MPYDIFSFPIFLALAQTSDSIYEWDSRSSMITSDGLIIAMSGLAVVVVSMSRGWEPEDCYKSSRHPGPHRAAFQEPRGPQTYHVSNTLSCLGLHVYLI